MIAHWYGFGLQFVGMCFCVAVGYAALGWVRRR